VRPRVRGMVVRVGMIPVCDPLPRRNRGEKPVYWLLTILSLFLLECNMVGTYVQLITFLILRISPSRHAKDRYIDCAIQSTGHLSLRVRFIHDILARMISPPVPSISQGLCGFRINSVSIVIELQLLRDMWYALFILLIPLTWRFKSWIRSTVGLDRDCVPPRGRCRAESGVLGW
jgi:hypothetical protein